MNEGFFRPLVPGEYHLLILGQGRLVGFPSAGLLEIGPGRLQQFLIRQQLQAGGCQHFRRHNSPFTPSGSTMAGGGGPAMPGDIHSGGGDAETSRRCHPTQLSHIRRASAYGTNPGGQGLDIVMETDLVDFEESL